MMIAMLTSIAKIITKHEVEVQLQREVLGRASSAATMVTRTSNLTTTMIVNDWVYHDDNRE
jgi:hypothetical protein